MSKNDLAEKDARLEPGSSGTARLQPGSSSHPGTAGLQPGSSSHPGTARLQPGSSVTPVFFPNPAGAFSPAAMPHWHSRGYVPHFDTAYHVQHVTFRLADSLAQETLEGLEQELLALPEKQRDVERRQRIEAWLDAGHGSCLLREVDAAQLVEAALLHFDGVRYNLFAWVIMPNHTHILFQEKEGWPMRSIITTWKSYTGRRLMPLLRNKAIGKHAKQVWQREYWDRFIRNAKHFQDAKTYIEHNPVKAGLVAHPADWQWSSAKRARLEPGAPGTAGLQPGTTPKRARLEPRDPGTTPKGNRQ